VFCDIDGMVFEDRVVDEETAVHVQEGLERDIVTVVLECGAENKKWDEVFYLRIRKPGELLYIQRDPKTKGSDVLTSDFENTMLRRRTSYL